MGTESTVFQSLYPSDQHFPSRRNARASVELDVKLHLTRRVFIPAQMVDVSATGFRVRHQSAGIALGMIVHAWGYVSARVVWTRTSEGITESGFELVS
ncbi:MAG: PilZ domain-containing protein [Candidatus Korobacteraceae bacterium]